MNKDLKKINIGIIFPGNHFFNNILQALEKNLNINIYSVLCRNLRKKNKFKNIKNLKIYKNINRFLSDKDLDTVYICSPNGLHANHALKALQNNKNVICEKPLVTTLFNFKKLIKTSKKNNKFIFEAFMFQHHEQFKVLKRLINNKKIGKILSINSSFCIPNRKKQDIRYNKKLGGGAFLDIGCYLIKISNLIFKKKPNKILLEKYISKKYKVDTYGSCQLFYRNGSIANLEWGIGFQYINKLLIITSNSTLLLERIFSKNKKEDYFIKISKNNKFIKKIKIKKMDHFNEMFNVFFNIIKYHKVSEYSKYLSELKFHQDIYFRIFNKYYL